VRILLCFVLMSAVAYASVPKYEAKEWKDDAMKTLPSPSVFGLRSDARI
jgi:hypothetical protein